MNSYLTSAVGRYSEWCQVPPQRRGATWRPERGMSPCLLSFQTNISNQHVKPNILINDNFRACLCDFGLTAVTYNPNSLNAITTSSEVNGSIRWIAPEIINSEEFGLPRRRPSPESDIYALGMVMLEVVNTLSILFTITRCLIREPQVFTGKFPFYEYHMDATVVYKIMSGARPQRPPVHPTVARGLSDAVWNLSTQLFSPVFL